MNRSYDCYCLTYDTDGVGLEMMYRFSNISSASKRNYPEVDKLAGDLVAS